MREEKTDIESERERNTINEQYTTRPPPVGERTNQSQLTLAIATYRHADMPHSTTDQGYQHAGLMNRGLVRQTRQPPFPPTSLVNCDWFNDIFIYF